MMETKPVTPWTLSTSFRAYSIAAVSAFALTLILWMLRPLLTLPSVSLIYVLLVLVIAIQQGTKPSLLTAIISFLCFNYFLIEPYYTFLVADPREILDLIVFLIVALLTGQLMKPKSPSWGRWANWSRIGDCERDY